MKKIDKCTCTCYRHVMLNESGTAGKCSCCNKVVREFKDSSFSPMINEGKVFDKVTINMKLNNDQELSIVNEIDLNVDGSIKGAKIKKITVDGKNIKLIRKK